MYRFQWLVLTLQDVLVEVFLKQIVAHYRKCFTLNIENPKKEKNSSWIENKTVEAIKVLTFLVCVGVPCAIN